MIGFMFTITAVIESILNFRK